MRIAFESSHITGDFSSGWLRVDLGIADELVGQSTWDEIVFSVPPDFHAHNDAVAAALMTLVGTRYHDVTFNFPISTACAETLGRFYPGVEMGPVDPSAESRHPGAQLALNFSGGLDSTAVWAILDEALGGDFAVVTSEYGGSYAFEAHGYERYRRDVSCRTNVRSKRYSRNGRFNFCVPLLFADYLDLGSITTGHSILLADSDLDPLTDGGRPAFLHDDLVVNAAGLEEVHLIRGLWTQGLFRTLIALAPERAEHALAASARPGTRKHFLRAWILRSIYEDLRLPAPAYLRHVPPPNPPIEFGASIGPDIVLLGYVKREGITAARRICPKLARFDLSFLDDLSLNFFWRYHTHYAELIPQPMRERVLPVFERCGVQASEARDLEELARVREFLAESGMYPRQAAFG
jgi:hypothetical protein